MSKRNDRKYDEDGIDGEVIDGSWGKDLDRRGREVEPEYDEDYEDEDVDPDINEPQVVRRRPANRRERRSAGHIPPNAPRPQDRKAPKKSAAQREAEADEFLYIDFYGETFQVIADQEEWPILAAQAFSKRQSIDAIEHLLGPRQWALFVTRFPKTRQFNEFAELVAEEFGFGTSGE